MSATGTLISRSATAEATEVVAGPVVRVRLSGYAPTGPMVLLVAAELLPVVAGGTRVRYGDLHQTLFDTLSLLRPSLGEPHLHRLADEALDLLAGYLMVARLVDPQGRTSQTVRTWMVYQDLAGIRLALAGAGRFWHRELRAALR